MTKGMMNGMMAAALVVLGLAGAGPAASGEPAPMHSPHRVPLGFFDIHVCQWSDRPLFFMALFSTTRYEELAAVEILDPDGRSLGALDLTKYRLTVAPGKPEKRAFISQIPVPDGASRFGPCSSKEDILCQRKAMFAKPRINSTQR